MRFSNGLLSQLQELLNVGCEELCSDGNKDDAEELAEHDDEALAETVLELASEGDDEEYHHDVGKYCEEYVWCGVL